MLLLPRGFRLCSARPRRPRQRRRSCSLGQRAHPGKDQHRPSNHRGARRKGRTQYAMLSHPACSLPGLLFFHTLKQATILLISSSPPPSLPRVHPGCFPRPHRRRADAALPPASRRRRLPALDAAPRLGVRSRPPPLPVGADRPGATTFALRWREYCMREGAFSDRNLWVRRFGRGGSA